ncbi:MAG TPA: hypothetical protein DCY94_05135, partial [Firmicutes bacterium]|nr:hypothetical protein [Bacillota bacterium]
MARKRKKFKNSALVPITLISLIGMLTFMPNISQFIPIDFSFMQKRVYHNYDVGSIPEYSGEKYIILNNNEPYFDSSEYDSESFENYSELDSLGRCGVAFANIGKDL